MPKLFLAFLIKSVEWPFPHFSARIVLDSSFWGEQGERSLPLRTETRLLTDPTLVPLGPPDGHPAAVALHLSHYISLSQSQHGAVTAQGEARSA